MTEQHVAGCAKECFGAARCAVGWPDGSCGAKPQGTGRPPVTEHTTDLPTKADERTAILAHCDELAQRTTDVGVLLLAAKARRLCTDIDRLTAERDKYKDHIKDIAAHATPYGDLPNDPGYVGIYLLTAGALHRALGTLGHTMPSCQAEADLAAERAKVADLQTRLDADIDRLTRERDSVNRRWRSFESAPTDGTEILVYREDSGAFTARYTPALTEDGEEDLENYCWFTTDGYDLTGDLPTHWMPLPKGPEGTQSDDGGNDRLAAERADLQARLDAAQAAAKEMRRKSRFWQEWGEPASLTPWLQRWVNMIASDAPAPPPDDTDDLEVAAARIRVANAERDASEAGAAAMRQALKTAGDYFVMLAEAFEDDSFEFNRANSAAEARAEAAVVYAALANPAGAALLEERKRVRKLPDAWERNGWPNVTSQDSGLSGYSEGLITCAANLRSVLAAPVGPSLLRESQQAVEVLREFVGWMDNLRLGINVDEALTAEGRAEFMDVLERARKLAALSPDSKESVAEPGPIHEGSDIK